MIIQGNILQARTALSVNNFSRIPPQKHTGGEEKKYFCWNYETAFFIKTLNLKVIN
jgi:hypothetical protein